MNKIKNVYKILLKNYSKQGWWPLSKNSLHSNHYNGKPKNDKDKFEIIVGAILTQNTSWTNVEKAIYNLNKAKSLSLKKIHKIRQERLAILIKPSGYYNQKAKKLKAFTNFLIKNYGGSLKKLFSEKELRKILLKVHGVGPETADSIILYAAEKPIFVIDAYTKRIFSRRGYKINSYDAWQELFMKNLKRDVKIFKEYHALLVKVAKDCCKKKPSCQKCPLGSECERII